MNAMGPDGHDNDNDFGTETPRRRIPVPLQAQPQPRPLHHTPLCKQRCEHSLSAPNTTTKHKPPEKSVVGAGELHFAERLIAMVLHGAQCLNDKISDQERQQLESLKDSKSTATSLMRAPILRHLVRSCMASNKAQCKATSQNQVISFFVEHFQRIFPLLTFPRVDHLQSQLEAASFPQKDLCPTTATHSIGDSMDVFIEKVHAVGTRLGQSVHRRPCTVRKPAVKPAAKERTDRKSHRDLLKEWESSHHHLGKKQQENIDLLQYQTRQFEGIATRIHDALQQTENPQLFESKLQFITKQTQYLERQIDAAQHSMAEKAKSLEQTVKSALDKYREVEDIGTLVSSGVSPRNILGMDPPLERDDCQSVGADDKISEKEQELSFLNRMDQSRTGFDYEQKRKEIRNIIGDVLDCKLKIDDNISKSIKVKVPHHLESIFAPSTTRNDDEEWRRSIQKRIKSIIHQNRRQSLNVHWDAHQERMSYAADFGTGTGTKHKVPAKIQPKLPVTVPLKATKSIAATNSTPRTTRKHLHHSIPVHIAKKKPHQAPPCPLPQSRRGRFKVRSRNVKSKKQKKATSISLGDTASIHKLPRRTVGKSSTSIQTHNVENSGMQTDPLPIKRDIGPSSASQISFQSARSSVRSSAELDLQKMAECKEQDDTVNIESIESLCDDVLDQLCNAELSTLQKHDEEEMRQKEEVQAVLEYLIEGAMSSSKKGMDHVLASPDIIISAERIQVMVPIEAVPSPMTRTYILEETIAPKATVLCRGGTTGWTVEDGVNEQRVQSDNLRPLTAPCTSTFVQSPICRKYNDNLHRLKQSIKGFSSPNANAQSHSVSTCSTASTSLVSSIDCSIDVSDSLWSGVSGIPISQSSTFGDDISESQLESQDYQKLKDSLNRQWTDIQQTLRTLAE